MTINKSKAICNLVSAGTEWSVFNNSEVIWHTVVGTKPTDAEISAEVDRLTALEPWNELRAKRNQLLAETDWTANSDVTMSDEMTTYRQALRDLPANTADPANPSWPTKPGD
jgi:S-adenosylmethionine:tRNA-ribosyltransferase-isomerase (queuine synthetase)